MFDKQSESIMLSFDGVELIHLNLHKLYYIHTSTVLLLVPFANRQVTFHGPTIQNSAKIANVDQY